MRILSALPSALLVASLLAPQAPAQTLRTEFFGEPFGRITDIASIPGDPSRLFSVDKTGRIRILAVPSGNVIGTFLDISGMVDDDGEGGMLGLAFHPDYLTNGKFYVSYTTGVAQGDSMISEFTVSAGDPNQADPASETIVWGPLTQTSSGHKAGDLEFGPDGKLYYSIGDGDPAGGDSNGRAQNLMDPRGKILRFDVDQPFPHVPLDNPFVGDANALDHIWALGFRNPWRISVDPLTGDVYVGDVGQSAKEEVSFIPGGVGGLNFGWNCREGSGCFGGGGCTDCGNPAFIDPVFEYDNGPVGCAVIGGVVYRGSAIPGFQGHYVFSDFCTEDVTSFRVVGGVATDIVAQTNMVPSSGSWNNLGAWGRDANGEIYVANHFGGQIFKVVGDCTGSVTKYCVTSPNSVGAGAIITGGGSTSIAANDLNLNVSGVGAHKFGLYYYGATQLSSPFGDGVRCVGAPSFRIRPIVQTNGNGFVSLPLDYSAPQAMSIAPGTVWNFQFWYRDSGPAGFNLSDAMEVSFCP